MLRLLVAASLLFANAAWAQESHVDDDAIVMPNQPVIPQMSIAQAPAKDGETLITATFTLPGEYAPLEINLMLGDGDALSFGLPGYPEALFHIRRTGQHVATHTDIIEFSDYAQIN